MVAVYVQKAGPPGPSALSALSQPPGPALSCSPRSFNNSTHPDTARRLSQGASTESC